MFVRAETYLLFVHIHHLLSIHLTYSINLSRDFLFAHTRHSLSISLPSLLSLSFILFLPPNRHMHLFLTTFIVFIRYASHASRSYGLTFFGTFHLRESYSSAFYNLQYYFFWSHFFLYLNNRGLSCCSSPHSSFFRCIPISKTLTDIMVYLNWRLQNWRDCPICGKST